MNSSHNRIILIAALAAGVVATVLCAILEWRVGATPYRLSLMAIVPIGAAIFGAAVSGCIAAAVRFTHAAPSRGITRLMLFASLTSYCAVEFASFLIHANALGSTVIHRLSLADHLRGAYMHAQSGAHGNEVDDDDFVFFLAALQIVGVTLGSIAVSRSLTQLPCCDRCTRYMKARERRTVYYRDRHDDFTARYARARQMLSNGDTEACITELSRDGLTTRESLGLAPYSVLIELYACGKCSKRLLQLSAKERGPQMDWLAVPDSRARAMFNERTPES